ncbi:MAG: hypothetical protein KJ952_05150 [Candidatus Omnitrophica bacterium]|nr:hypothetical protein [Candidatus Omnitrophota bacterium]
MKISVFIIAVFFILTDVSYATVSSSKNYKLHTSVADGGGASGASTSYTAQNSVGSPLGTSPAVGTNYKIYGGMLATTNAIPDVSIVSYNDGTLIMDDTPTLAWSYNDKDADKQIYYQVQVSKDNFATFTVDSGLVVSNSESFTSPILPTDEAGVSYRWRVRVSDGFDYSGWKVATYGFRLTTTEMEVPIVWAKVSSIGEDIPAKLWQACGTPYMYWEYPVTGADITGYSYSWGSIPNDEIDTAAVAYQTPDDLLSDGTRVFNLKAQNTAGNWSEVANFEIWIDRAEPVIGSYSPTNGAIISTDTPTISISVLDEASGVDPDGIVMKINKSGMRASYDEKAKSVVYIPSTPLSEGDNVLSLEVSDIVGNKTSLVVWSFVVDTRAATGTIIINNQDAVTNTVYVNLTLSAEDVTTGVKSMAISNDGVFDTESWEAFNTRKDNWTLPAITGTRKVYVKFKDDAGNESQIFSDTIELIIIAPDTIITSGPSLVTISTDCLFTFKSSTSGCVFRWKFDDGEWSDWSNETSARKEGLPEGNHYFKVQSAKDVNNNEEIDLDEIDPVPEERTWTVGKQGSVILEKLKKRPFRFWKKE